MGQSRAGAGLRAPEQPRNVSESPHLCTGTIQSQENFAQINPSRVGSELPV